MTEDGQSVAQAAGRTEEHTQDDVVPLWAVGQAVTHGHGGRTWVTHDSGRNHHTHSLPVTVFFVLLTRAVVHVVATYVHGQAVVGVFP